ncbi:MAG: hypothetical protein JSS83_02595 [Cyanobacteria bacterium SZAS LIN-3]|nr:hypothetical protein [Cyanobacteria bacterium SZAS LIN-3]
MTASLEKRENGEIALLIKGDLQFDSSDENIYHEALSIPALALAAKRSRAQLKVLVIGGGDGLVARELFKSARVDSVDLVDYDPEILHLARTDFASLNNHSLTDPRITVHVEDAWEFVEKALQSGRQFDLIISDLTVPETAHEARFHSIDWYEKLSGLLTRDGIIAANGVSAQATPQAFWCVFNSLLKAGLHVRPYHVEIPSFAARGYGDDWAFFLASPIAITGEELNIDLSVAEPRTVLTEVKAFQSLFLFPEALFQYQPQAKPTRAGSDVLIHYFIDATPISDTTGGARNLFVETCDEFSAPEADTTTHILTPELSQALASALQPAVVLENDKADGIQRLLRDTMASLPELQKQQTETMIANFVEAPSRFLQGIDLTALTDRLLRRAAELPEYLVTELKHLKAKLADWSGDRENLLTLGHRVMSILVLAIVLGNLLYPDAVYAKDGGHHGRRGADGGYWNGGGSTYYYNQPGTVIKKGPIGPGPNDAAVKRMQKQGALPVKNNLANAQPIDQTNLPTGIAINADGKQLEIKAADGTAHYIPTAGWYEFRSTLSQQDNTPSAVRASLVAYLKQTVRDNNATSGLLQTNRDELRSQADMLETELSQYRSAGDQLVSFGTRTIKGDEAVILTEKALNETRQNILEIEARLATLPDHADQATQVLKILSAQQDA